MMPVEINLQAEGTPGGNAHITQSQFFVDEIEVVMQALAVVGAQVRLTRRLVVPRPIRGTRFHGGEDPDQTRVLASLLEDLVNLVLLAKALRSSDELDLQPVLDRQLFSVFPQRLAQRLRPARIVKDANLMGVKISRHALGITETRQSALNQHAVVTGKHASDLAAPAFSQ